MIPQQRVPLASPVRQGKLNGPSVPNGAFNPYASVQVNQGYGGFGQRTGGAVARMRPPTYLSSPVRRGFTYNNGLGDGNGQGQGSFGTATLAPTSSAQQNSTPTAQQSGFPSPDTFARGLRAQQQSNAGSESASSWTTLDVSNMKLLYLAPALWSYSFLTVLMLNNNRLPVISPEVAQLVNLQKLDLSDNQLRELPAEIGTLCRLQELLLSNNQLTRLPYSFGQLIELRRLELRNNPWEEPFSSLQDQGAQMIVTYLLDAAPPLSPPPERQWLTVDESPALPHETFTLLCYNVLCDTYATRQLYSYCPTWALDWDHRKEQLLKEIVQCSADFVCLQEVETSQFHAYFAPELRTHGYEGVFHPKTRSRTMGDEDRKRVDGCATFYRNSKFVLVEEHLVDFTALALSLADMGGDMINRVMPKV